MEHEETQLERSDREDREFNARRLDEIEREDAARRASDPAGRLAPDDPSYIVGQQMTEEANERAARRELPATRGQIDQLIAVMTEVRDLLGNAVRGR